MKKATIIPATRISLSGNQGFTYSVPASMDKKILPGAVVKIPFGNREILGVVKSVGDDSESALLLKSIKSFEWEERIFTPELMKLAQAISEHYLVSLGLIVKSMLTRTAPRAKEILPPDEQTPRNSDLVLTGEQKAAVDEMSRPMETGNTFLLHGVTGSGKTEVYLRLMKKTLDEKKQVLLLVPEIALTPQTSSRIISRFPGVKVGIVHSKISYGQKYLIWKSVFSGQTRILIGPRSAVFAPFASLGLIVVDEEHDSSYKQTDQNPKFHAVWAARKLSGIWRCPLVLGDATPSVETYWSAENGLIKKLSLTKRIRQEMPKVEIVDMRQESQAGNFSIFSKKLSQQVADTLAKKLQTILFVNRRGSATSQSCRDCGQIVLCKRCEGPLAYHRSLNALLCHHCERRYPVLAVCPSCHSHRLKFFGTGTEKVEMEIAALFPKSRIKRLDRDSVKNKKELNALYEDFLSRDYDILVGTQIIAKGWDLSTVGLIGVINADTQLQLPDYRSNERTFQLITQVAGRSGRGDFPGRVLIQTYLPENFALQAALDHDYNKFFGREIADRREFGYPPFWNLIKLTYKHPNFDKAMSSAGEIADKLGKLNLSGRVSVIGPSPAFIPRIRGRWFVYVIIKIMNGLELPPIPQAVAEFLNDLPAGWDIDVDPDNLL